MWAEVIIKPPQGSGEDVRVWVKIEESRWGGSAELEPEHPLSCGQKQEIGGVLFQRRGCG